MNIQSVAASPEAADSRDATPAARATKLRQLGNGYTRKDKVTAELRRWHGLPRADQIAALTLVSRSGSGLACESISHICALAMDRDDRELLNVAFEALVRAATPMLMNQLRGESTEDRDDRVQDVLVAVFNAIQDGKADFAESNFRAFARRRSIEVCCKRKNQLEAQHRRQEPTKHFDPVAEVSAKGLDPEQRARVADQLQRGTNYLTRLLQNSSGCAITESNAGGSCLAQVLFVADSRRGGCR